MKKALTILLLSFLFCNTSVAESYFFKGCKISNTVSGNYIINVKKNIIEVELKNETGLIQNFSDKIKSIETNKIVSEKIKSGKGDKIYYQYFLNSQSKSVIKLEFKKESGFDGDVFRLKEKKVSHCMDFKGGWDKKKIEKTKANSEQNQILHLMIHLLVLMCLM